jgi:hypothetical protein
MKRYAIALLAFGLLATSSMADQSFVGRWAGTATILNVWAHGKRFRVTIDIHRDGTVSGAVGNAKLIAARFGRWRPVGEGRKGSGDMMDYMITGRLAGFIIPAEHISATNVYIPLDSTDGTFDAGLNAHGTVRGTEQMDVMSCDLTWRRLR